MRKYAICYESDLNPYGYIYPTIGPWSPFPCEPKDFLRALEVIDEWGRNRLGNPRKKDKICIYDKEEDKVFTQDHCFKILEVLG